ncbi:protein Smaug homolog 1 [Sitophilus oryzae]|uniref:Protein Smaug homolog 1 n=1 Tax=Sitophilus oryzae TaxID=7048 RepID=A0A6J2XUQ5_SITOR|nr:protein Smaug homolog 1 [Sitophilus oryzae]XP_030754511.1 protein Smaug homolog 1 [Sitophilus oryzae]
MEFETTKDFSEFCQHLSDLRVKFQKWDSCEKTVALYYLMVGLPFSNAKFLQNALNQLLPTINTADTQRLENNANNPAVIDSFLAETPQTALCLLLHHLPMLKPGNREAAQTYLNTIRRILTEFITPPFKKIYNECVEIMSYVYIHPAFDKDDKRSFKHLLKQVINKVSPENFVHSPVSEIISDSGSDNPDLINNNKKRSNSLIPESTYVCDIENWSSQENLVNRLSKPRSYSLSCEKNTLQIPQIHTSSSETKLQEIIIKNNLPIMKSILSWLKSLRLHKYSWIFNNLTAGQMLNLTEDYLIGVGVTKGARHKLLISLEKLRGRMRALEDLEMAVLHGGDLNKALKELKSILYTPLQISMGEDLYSQFVRVMGKVCAQLLTMRNPSDENLVLFNSMCEKAEDMDGFTYDHKKKLSMWREQLAVGSNLPIYPQGNCCRKSIRNKQTKNPKSYIFEASVDPSSGTQKSSSYPNMQSSSSYLGHRHSVDSVTLKSQLLHINPASSREPCPNDKCGTNSSRLKSNCQSVKNNLDIESSLESLCIQMMEHALGP